MKNTPTISLPQGVRDILPEETQKISLAESSILKVFEKRLFSKVITPLLEYVDVLSLGMGAEMKDRVLKFIDPSTGRVVAIRPDITPQIARVAASRMKDYGLPLKLCYNENVIRYQDPRGGKSREVLQIGAEYISQKSSPEADSEMISMAIEALEATGLKDFKIDIGDVGFLKTILSGLEVPEPGRRVIKEAIAKKDAAGLGLALDGLGVELSPTDRELLTGLTTLYGEEEVIDRAETFLKDGPALEVLKNLRKVFDLVAEKGYKDRLTIDLGEVRGFDYYTGIIFEGFASGFGKAILSGGRYDNLLKKYGYECAATGFAFDVENIVAALEA
jgi:ATP phosphoribosyltransferase regulatory subunit